MFTNYVIKIRIYYEDLYLYIVTNYTSNVLNINKYDYYCNDCE
jgi:hypothetical protein